MKCPTHSTRFLAHLLLAYTPIQGVRRQSLDLGGLDLGLEEDAAEICTVDGLRTPYGAPQRVHSEAGFGTSITNSNASVQELIDGMMGTRSPSPGGVEADTPEESLRSENPAPELPIDHLDEGCAQGRRKRANGSSDGTQKKVYNC
ncbi:hypothetical protein MTO96_039100 [Rhipicephalus appendiculatus]